MTVMAAQSPFQVGDTVRITRLHPGHTPTVWEGAIVEGDGRAFCLRGHHVGTGKEEYGWFDGDAERLRELYGCEQTIEVIEHAAEWDRKYA